MGALPTGTVTLLFSDVEGSTRLLSRLGDDYIQALEGQRAVLRRAWAQYGGAELGTEGDSFFVAFDDASSAVRAAVQAQREIEATSWPLAERVRVRIGIHTGAPMRHGDGYVGMDVHRAARVAAAAHGGQVLVSEATASLVTEEPIGFKDLGFHTLKDLPRPEHLFQVTAPGLRDDFEVVRALGSVAALPSAPTALVGRTAELAALTQLLSSPHVRVVTLTGPGGAGKTRLAAALAQATADRYPQGVFFVPLEGATTSDTMWTSLATALGVPPEGRIPPGLFDHIATRAALVVLDNLEQVAGAAQVVRDLVEGAPSIRVVATSRQPLHLPGEQEYPVPPLPVPVASDPATVTEAPAVQLFVQQARLVKPTFALSQSNSADVAAVCRRLDGLPLALELAAARLKLLTPQSLLSRLDQALDLRSADPTRADRQRTLRQTLAWSYDLLSKDEQRLFRSLSVFAGGADLTAVEAVWAAVSGPESHAEAVELLERLVDASLVVVTEDADGNPRVGTLNTVRSYAAEQLRASPERTPAHEAAVGYFDRLLRDLEHATDAGWRERLTARCEIEHQNCRACLEWLLSDESGATSDARGLSVTLQLTWRLSFWFLVLKGYLEECRRWCERALRAAEDRRGVRVGACQAALSFAVATLDDAERAAELALSAWENCAAPGPEDSDLTEDEVDLMRFSALNARAIAATMLDDQDGGRELFEQVVARTKEPSARAVGVLNLATSLTREGQLQRAEDLYREAAALGERVGDEIIAVGGLAGIASLQRLMGDAAGGAAQLRRLYPRLRALADPLAELEWAEDYAAALAELRLHDRAALITGAATAMRDRIGARIDPSQARHTSPALDAARDAMGRERWEDAVARGRGMTVDQAVATTDAP